MLLSLLSFHIFITLEEEITFYEIMIKTVLADINGNDLW